MISGEILTEKGWRYPGQKHTIAIVDADGRINWAKNVEFTHYACEKLIRVCGINVDFMIGPSTKIPYRKMTRVAVSSGATCKPGTLTRASASDLLTARKMSRGAFIRWTNVCQADTPYVFDTCVPDDQVVAYYMANQFRLHEPGRILTEAKARKYVPYIPNRPQFPGRIFDPDALPFTLAISESGFNTLLEHLGAVQKACGAIHVQGDLDYLQALSTLQGYASVIHSPRKGAYLRIRKVQAGPVLGPDVKISVEERPAWDCPVTGIITRNNGRVRVV